MDLGLATALATGAGVYLVYGKKGKIASAAAVLTGVALYIAYYCKLKSNPVLAAAIENEKLNNHKTLVQWEPLSTNDWEYIKSMTSSNPVRFVADP